MDESTDLTNLTLLLIFVRYCGDANVHDDLLFCKELPIRTTAVGIFCCPDTYLANKAIDWEKCVNVCTDGAVFITDIHCGVVKQIQLRAEQAKWTHCFLHRKSLDTRHYLCKRT